MKVVIANSVGVDERGNHIVHFPSRWTASVGKTKCFTYYPYELAYLSSLLKKETDYDVKMIDGNLLQLNADQYIESLKRHRPEWLIMEPATMTYAGDLKIAKAMKLEFGTNLIFVGPHATAFSRETMADGIDFVCTGEYELTVLDILQGKPRIEIQGLYPNAPRPLLDVNALPFPEDDDISRWDYIGIDGSEYKEIEVFGSRGCPMMCTFCVCSNLYYAHPNWRPRIIDNIIAEIRYLRNKYPRMEGIFFDEEFHNGTKKFIMELTEAIRRHGFDDLKYNAMCGYWTMDKEMIEAMRAAGYYKLRIGIETASEVTAKAIKKRIDIPRLKSVLQVAKEVGMEMYGTFTFGAPGSTKVEDMKTIQLIRELIDDGLLTDFQVSICTPQPGTPFFNMAKGNGYLSSTNWIDYDGAQCAVVNYPNYSSREIEENYRIATALTAYCSLKNTIHKTGFFRPFKEIVSQYGILGGLKKGRHILRLIKKRR